MAGLGERFLRAGYILPKYMIEAGGATLFEHSVRSLPLEPAGKIVFIALRAHQAEFGLEKFISDAMARVCGGAALRPEIEIVLLDAPTRGQAETVLKARSAVPAGAGLGIYNIDTRFESDTLAARLSGPGKRDGVIGSFKLSAKDPKWSFAQTGPGGIVTRTAEKVQISANALTGFYHFTDAADFFGIAEKAIAQGDAPAGEFYVAPMYNALIAAGKEFVLDEVKRLVPLGTPEDVRKLSPDGK